MSRFHFIPAPVFSPTRCVACGANRDANGFVDLLVDDAPVNGYDDNGAPNRERPGEPMWGHLYLCATCIDQVIAARGGLDPDHASRLRDQIAGKDETIADLETRISVLVEEGEDFVRAVAARLTETAA